METLEESIRILKEAEKYIVKNQELLKRSYEDNYIAIRNDVVLGYNKDQFVLAREMEKKFHDKTVLIRTIDDTLNPIADELSSPEV